MKHALMITLALLIGCGEIEDESVASVCVNQSVNLKNCTSSDVNVNQEVGVAQTRTEQNQACRECVGNPNDGVTDEICLAKFGLTLDDCMGL